MTRLEEQMKRPRRPPKTLTALQAASGSRRFSGGGGRDALTRFLSSLQDRRVIEAEHQRALAGAVAGPEACGHRGMRRSAESAGRSARKARVYGDAVGRGAVDRGSGLGRNPEPRAPSPGPRTSDPRQQSRCSTTRIDQPDQPESQPCTDRETHPRHPMVEEIVGAVHDAQNAIWSEVLRDKCEQRTQDHQGTGDRVRRSICRHDSQEHGQAEQSKSADEQDQRVDQRIADRVALTHERRQRADQQRRQHGEGGDLRQTQPTSE